jgi:hypothetical protein
VRSGHFTGFHRSLTENRSVDGSIPPLATINRFSLTD